MKTQRTAASLPNQGSAVSRSQSENRNWGGWRRSAATPEDVISWGLTPLDPSHPPAPWSVFGQVLAGMSSLRGLHERMNYPFRTEGNMHRHRFDLLLFTLILLLLSAPVVRALLPLSHPQLARITVNACFAVMLLSAVFAISEGRRTVIAASSLAVPVVLLSGMTLLTDQKAIFVAYHLLGILFLGYTIVVILAFLFREQRVTLNIICASLCVYLLLGVLWSIVYSLLDVLEPQSFIFAFAEDDSGPRMRFGAEQSIFPLYYSLVTMTTLGYGDIVPASSSARMFAAVQALMGQLYLAVLVARLVGLHISQAAGGNHQGGDPSGKARPGTDR